MQDSTPKYTQESLHQFGDRVQDLIKELGVLSEFDEITKHFWNTDYDRTSKYDGTMCLLGKIHAIFDVKAITSEAGRFPNGVHKRTMTIKEDQYQFMRKHPKHAFLMPFWLPDNELLVVDMEACIQVPYEKLNDNGLLKLSIPGHAVWGTKRGVFEQEILDELAAILKKQA